MKKPCSLLSPARDVEPAIGVEPTRSAGLGRCSTIELRRRIAAGSLLSCRGASLSLPSVKYFLEELHSGFPDSAICRNRTDTPP